MRVSAPSSSGAACRSGPGSVSSTGCGSGPTWHPTGTLRPGRYAPGGYAENEPATLNALRNTLTRSWMHRRLWLNDPDCLMLRTAETGLTPAEAHAWALAVGTSGGMALVSDDLALLDPGARRLLEEVVALGRSVDGRQQVGRRPRAPICSTPPPHGP